ncbi:MAG TPA: hypothetical protein DCX00_00935, partial [Flavobacteriales bacterium]|nr:hypothetical protein [Flavobacteriales bacterium]
MRCRSSTYDATSPTPQRIHAQREFPRCIRGEIRGDDVGTSGCYTHQRKLIHVTHLSKEFRIGVLVTAGLILLVLGVNYLKGSNPFKPSNSYFAKYDAIDGL